MTFRLLLVFALSMLPAAAHAVDCVTSTYGMLSIDGDPACGTLKEVYRKRDDPRPNVEIWARYVAFDPAVSAGERRFNDWMRESVAPLELDGPLKHFGDYTILDTLTVTSLYRSKSLLSALVEHDFGCGAHCNAALMSLNVDPATGRNIALGELVDRKAVGEHCWRQFYASEKGGAAFAERYTIRNFGQAEDSYEWSADASGIVLHFGELFGHAFGWFECRILTGELPKFTKPGVKVPL